MKINNNVMNIVNLEDIVSKLLKTMFKNYSIQSQLREILEILSKLDWLNIHFRGGIFLKNKNDKLILIASENFDEYLKEKYSQIDMGEYFPGKAAESGKIIYSEKINCSDHEFKKINKQNYSIPILDNEDVIGVLIIYLEKNHIQRDGEEEFIKLLSSVISTIIVKKILDERFKINQFKTEYFQRELLHKLVEASEFRDNETGKHIIRVTEYSVLIAKKLNLPDKDIELLRLGAPLHDVGKISIPDSILLKPGKLTEEEFNTMKTHTTVGGELLAETNSEYLNAAKDIALSHHEKWNGEGYPKGLKGTDIPLFGRICAVADVFDALSMERPYKKPWPMDKVINFFKENSGTHFDPEITEFFLNSIDEVLEIKALYQEDTLNIKENLLVNKFQNQKEEFVSWDNSLSTGFTLVDNEHKYLIRLMNNLYDSINRNDDIKRILVAIKGLREYTFIHFRDEEKIMRKYKYSLYDYHVKKHEYFEKKLEEFQNNVMEMPFLVGFEILEFLRNWLVDHIFMLDSKMKEHFQTF